VVLDQTASLALWFDQDLHRGASSLGPSAPARVWLAFTA
jgi:hypothetical protein